MAVTSNAGIDLKSRVLSAVDLVELIGRTVALKRMGKDYKGLCPFHQEKTPSFKVDPARQYFYCFGCKASGNAIDFVMKRDRVEFKDALRSLAEANGIELPKRNGLAQAGQRQALFDANAAAAMFFEKTLAHPTTGAEAREYLKSRGFSEETIKRFHIGLAPNAWDGLLKSDVGGKFPADRLLAAGLLKKRERDGGFYDTFRHRLMFPIRDETGRTIAFGGRVLPGSQEQAKYLNSPETELFSKSRTVYGLDAARQKIVQSRTAVVVEGYTDVVMAHQFGADNVVSVLGTAMTEQHVTILRRFADRIVLLFDADDAGEAAVDRTVGLFLTQPIEIAIATMPTGVDPDEFLLKEGVEAFEKLMAAAPDALTYKWKRLAKQFDESDGMTGQQKAVESYLNILAEARGAGPVDSLRWGSALTRVSRLTGIPVDDLNRRFRRTSAPQPRGRMETPRESNGVQPARPAVAASRTSIAQERAERHILGVLLMEPARWRRIQHRVTPDSFAHEGCRRLAEIYWNHQRDEGEPVFNEFLGLLSDPSLVDLAVEALEEAETLAEPDRTIGESLAYFDAQQRLRDERKLVATLRRTGQDIEAAQDETALLRQLQEKVRQPDARRTL